MAYDRPNRDVPAHRVTLTPSKKQEQDGDEVESDDVQKRREALIASRSVNSTKSAIGQKYVDDDPMRIEGNSIYL